MITRTRGICRHAWMLIAGDALQKCKKCGKIRAPKRNKLNASKQHYGGAIYDSGGEAGEAARLDMRVKVGDIRGYKRQVTVPLVVNGSKVAAMKVDFVVEHNDGSLEYREFKGFATADWRIKANLFRALYPERTYTVVRA